MPNTETTRKQRFLAALKIAGQTGGDWAESHGVDYSHLYRVLTGARESGRLLAEVDAFIATHLPPPARAVA